MLGYMLYQDTAGLLEKLRRLSGWFPQYFRLGMSAALIMFGLLLSLLPWKHGQDFNVKDEHEHEQGGENEYFRHCDDGCRHRGDLGRAAAFLLRLPEE